MECIISKVSAINSVAKQKPSQHLPVWYPPCPSVSLLFSLPLPFPTLPTTLIQITDNRSKRAPHPPSANNGTIQPTQLPTPLKSSKNSSSAMKSPTQLRDGIPLSSPSSTTTSR